MSDDRNDAFYLMWLLPVALGVVIRGVLTDDSFTVWTGVAVALFVGSLCLFLWQRNADHHWPDEPGDAPDA